MESSSGGDLLGFEKDDVASLSAADGEGDCSDKKIGSLGLLFSAVVSGLLTKTACAPMDRLRLLYQVQGMLYQQQRQATVTSHECPDAKSKNVAIKMPLESIKNKRYIAHRLKYGSISDALSIVIREEGFRGLWRGNCANAIRASTGYALKMPANDIIKSLFQTNVNEKQQEQHAENKYRVTQLLVAGFAAGILQKSVGYPMDIVSVRVAMGINTEIFARSTEKENFDAKNNRSVSDSNVNSDQGKKNCKGQKLAAGGGRYRGICDCFWRIYSLEGIRGFYKGYPLAIISGVPYVMLQMTVFDLTRRHLRELCGQTGDKSSFSADMIFAGLAGGISNISAQSIVFPFDTVKKRLMNDGIDGRKRLYKNTLNCIKAIYFSEGLSAFYHGIWPATLRCIPAGALQFTCYEAMKRLLLEVN